MPLPVIRVDLAKGQRDFGVHAPRVGVVDHGRATRGRFGRELERYVASGREEGDIDALERFGSRLPHRQSPPTSADGRTMIQVLSERHFPVGELRLLASGRSAGSTVSAAGRTLTVGAATPEAFDGVDIALFSAGGDVSLQLAPRAAAS